MRYSKKGTDMIYNVYYIEIINIKHHYDRF